MFKPTAILALALISATGLFAREKAAANVAPLKPPVVAVSPFTQGDNAFKERRDRKRAEEALHLYRELYNKGPQNSEAAWRLSMICYFMGVRVLEDSDEKKKIYAEGRDAGEAGFKANEKCAPCYFWAAINQALYGDTVGSLKMLFSLKEVRERLRKSIELDDTYAYGGAYRLLGLIEQKLPGILGGDNDRAKEYFQKAIKVAPDEPLNYLFLARLLEDEFDDPKAAISMASQGLLVRKPEPERIESVDAMVDLKAFVEKPREKEED